MNSRPRDPGAGSHLVSLPDGSEQWALWRCVGLRGAGFPIAAVLRLAAPLAAAAAGRLHAAEQEAAERHEAAVQAVSEEIERAERTALVGLVKAIQRLKKGKPVASTGLPAAARTAVERSAAAGEEVRRATEEYLDVFAAEKERLSGELREVARDGRFREAVLWQNRHALKTGIDYVLRHDAKTTSSRARQNEQIIASYLQRFAAKNDTIGFFGPVGWATIGEGEEPLALHHGSDFLAQRRVFFEDWCIDAVATLLSTDPALRRGLAPRRGLFVRADGEVVGGGPGPAPAPEMRAVLALCDGATPARELAERLVAAGNFPDAAAVYGALEQLQTAGVVTWGFELPIVSEPERPLRQQVERLEAAEAARQAALGTLGELESRRQAVAQAAGDERALDVALQQLEDHFTQLTGLDSTRAHGKAYAGRTLVYEDCRRGTQVELGIEILAALAPPLALLLTSARWLTHATAELHRERFEETHRELRHETGSRRIDLVSFCRRALPALLSPRTNPVVQQVLPQLRQRWAEILDLPDDGSRQLCYSSEELRPRVLRAFDAPGPGWTTARHHSPDLLLAARGPEAIRRGEYQVVLGELHVGANTLGTNLFVDQHPSPRDLIAAMERDVPESVVLPTFPKLWKEEATQAVLGVPLPGATGRMGSGLVTGKDFYLEITPAPPELPRSQVLSVAELVVEPGESGLRVVSRDGSRCFDLLDLLQTALRTHVIEAFKLFAPRPHHPRITIDRLILSRESWTLHAAELEFARAATEAQRFSETRRWADRLGLPRFLFVRTPRERKPFFLDLESPLSVEIFTKQVRSTAENGSRRVRLSEMVPGPEEAWLLDSAGLSYTSELRLIAVDRAG